MKMNIASEDDIAYYIRQFLEDVALALQLFFNAASRNRTHVLKGIKSMYSYS